jgi:hypothetical protein
VEGVILGVVSMDGLRIERVSITPPPSAEDPPGDQSPPE